MPPALFVHPLSTGLCGQSTRRGRFSDESFCRRDIQFNLPFVRIASTTFCEKFAIFTVRAHRHPSIAAIASQRPRKADYWNTPLTDRDQHCSALIVAPMQNRTETSELLGLAEKRRDFDFWPEPRFHRHIELAE